MNLSRLDWFYVSNYFRDRGGTIAILSSTNFSNHVPVMLNIEDTIHYAFKILEKVLLDDAWLDDVQHIWISSQSSTDNVVEKVVMGIRQLSPFFQDKAKEEKLIVKHKEIGLRKGVASYRNCNNVSLHVSG